MNKKLYSFDFDLTLFQTPEPEEGKEIWLEKTGNEWPHIGWWSRPETLDSDVFDIKRNEWTYEQYLKATSDNNAYIILATGRISKFTQMRFNVKKILSDNNMVFDEIHLNHGGSTLEFKKNLFQDLIERTQCEEFTMFDDREDHLLEFEDWAKEQKCKVVIYDAINHTKKVINNVTDRSNS